MESLQIGGVKTLCLKFHQKHSTLTSFLSSSLRGEGGYGFKKAIVNAMLEIIHGIPAAKTEGLEYLCEYIEDCEYPTLSVKILDLLGKEGPK